eukprot:gene2564-5005_t
MKSTDPSKRKHRTASIFSNKFNTVKFAANNASSHTGKGVPMDEDIDEMEFLKKLWEPDDDDVIGELKDPDSRKSNIMERNLNQMVDVLHLRLAALEEAASVRLSLCQEDLLPNSKKMSENAPRLMDDFEDANPRNFRDKISGSSNKDINLVTSDGIFIDPIRLALKTRLVTETGKKLESKLEESFGIPNLRELKGKKSKTSNRAARSKKSEARKFEAKKQQRQRLEKDLQANMEAYVTRSVTEVEFRLPKHEDNFPISVRWSSKDPRSNTSDNADGEMDPELLLQYSLERINLPSGENVFRWLVKQPILHSYFVNLFWFTKVKFYQRDGSSREEEKHLLKILSAEYVNIVELLSRHAPAENEKDFIFRYIPYILASSVFYAFYFLFPGGRHLYTKGFKKTVLLQIVQILFGIQLCPISIKVNWAKLFPEEAQEDDEAEDTDLFNTATAATTAPSKLINTDPTTMTFSPQTTAGDPMSVPKSAAGIGLLETDGDAAATLPLKFIGGVAGDMTMAMAARPLGLSRSAGSYMAVPPMTIGPSHPLTRTSLKPPLSRMSRQVLAPRQRKELLDANNISPLIQEYLGSSTSSGGRRPELFRRTVPVSWCVSGGSDTHRKKTIPKELHDELSNKAKSVKKSLRFQNSESQREQLKSLREIDNTCNKILAGGAATVGKLSLELVKRRKNPRASGLMVDVDTAAGQGYSGDQDFEDDDIDHLLSL